MYEVTMSNGDVAEAETLAGAMLAASTMHRDAEGHVYVRKVRVPPDTSHSAAVAALWACRQHCKEQGL